MKSVILALLCTLAFASCSDSESNDENRVTDLYSDGLFNIDKLQGFLHTDIDDTKELFDKYYSTRNSVKGFAARIDSMEIYMAYGDNNKIQFIRGCYAYDYVSNENEAVKIVNDHIKMFFGKGFKLRKPNTYFTAEDLLLTEPEKISAIWSSTDANSNIRYAVDTWDYNNSMIFEAAIYFVD